MEFDIQQQFAGECPVCGKKYVGKTKDAVKKLLVACVEKGTPDNPYPDGTKFEYGTDDHKKTLVVVTSWVKSYGKTHVRFWNLLDTMTGKYHKWGTNRFTRSFKLKTLKRKEI